jgi:hypothetical protein
MVADHQGTGDQGGVNRSNKNEVAASMLATECSVEQPLRVKGSRPDRQQARQVLPTKRPSRWAAGISAPGHLQTHAVQRISALARTIVPLQPSL